LGLIPMPPAKTLISEYATGLASLRDLDLIARGLQPRAAKTLATDFGAALSALGQAKPVPEGFFSRSLAELLYPKQK
jgi:hypothetical protein